MKDAKIMKKPGTKATKIPVVPPKKRGR